MQSHELGQTGYILEHLFLLMTIARAPWVQVGEMMDGRYEVFATHGKGVFSTVLRARDKGQQDALGRHPEVRTTCLIIRTYAANWPHPSSHSPLSSMSRMLQSARIKS